MLCGRVRELLETCLVYPGFDGIDITVKVGNGLAEVSVYIF